MKRLPVLILDPSDFFRQGVFQCLEQGFEIKSEAQNLAEAQHLLTFQLCDFLIIGPTFREAEGLAVCRSLRAQFAAVKVLLLTEYHSDPLFQIDAAAAGVDGLLRRRVCQTEMVAALEQIMTGQILFSREILAAAFQNIKLSPSECKVLKLWADEKTDQEIAEQLAMTLNTARTHAKNILRKLQVHNRQMAVRRARRRGLIE